MVCYIATVLFLSTPCILCFNTFSLCIFTHPDSNVIVHERGNLNHAKFRFQSAIYPAFGYIEWEDRRDHKYWLVPLVNIHDPSNHNIGTRNRRVTRRYADTQHSTGVPNNIDYINAVPNYQDWVVEQDLTRTHYEQLMDALDILNRRNIQELSVNNLPRIIITHSQVKDNEQCGICLEYFKAGDSCKKIPCDHLMHYSCLFNWLVNHGGPYCPMCRGPIFEVDG